MPDFDSLAKEFFLEESILEAVLLGREEDLYLVLRIYDGNTTIHFEGDFDSRVPGGRLVLKCGRYIFLDIDRLSPYETMDLLSSHDQDTSPQMQELRRTIIGWTFITDSEQLSRLGTHASGFRHLVCETDGMVIEVVFESLEISKTLPDFISATQ